jgi:hypothetical protein
LNCFLWVVCNPKGTVRWVVSHAHWSHKGVYEKFRF